MVIEIKNLSKSYQNHQALNQINLVIPSGSIFGLLGPNGAGKTSLIRIINQITAPDEGVILLNGERLNSSHISMIGYLPEERGLYKKMKVGEHLLYLAELKGMSKNEAMDELKKYFVKFGIQDWWNKPVEELSKGMQQKAQFIATIVHKPKLVILDEPFSGFDPINANLLKDEILELKENGATIIFSTHRMESVEELCDEIAMINHSQIVLQGNKIDILNQYKTREYIVEFEGDFLPQDELFEIVSKQEINDFKNQEISLLIKDGVSNNQVLTHLIGQLNLISFKEKIPSFNEIFIRVAQEL
ncbi:MAG: hypothetical protein RIR51_1469 [Bacteroidota bacterium]|jgi:ABC-2 type transport system ATP-binding protein